MPLAFLLPVQVEGGPSYHRHFLNGSGGAVSASRAVAASLACAPPKVLRIVDKATATLSFLNSGCKSFRTLSFILSSKQPCEIDTRITPFYR